MYWTSLTTLKLLFYSLILTRLFFCGYLAGLLVSGWWAYGWWSVQSLIWHVPFRDILSESSLEERFHSFSKKHSSLSGSFLSNLCYRAALRSLFKGTVSAFIPLVIFFFNITHGRTRYDKLFGSMVVDVSSLHRPLFVSGQGVNQVVNFNLNQGGMGPQVQVQIQRWSDYCVLIMNLFIDK